jgi:signal peptidase I
MENYQPPQPVFSPGSRPSLPPPPPPPVYNAPRPNRDGLKSILTTILILLIAPILALSITTFGFQSYEVDGPSMEPTLYTHERLIIWKVGRTWSRITDKEYIPKRGTVIVFIKRGMVDFESNKEKQLIKRIIGLPGERVRVKDGAITVFNDENPDGFNPDTKFNYVQDLSGPTDGEVDINIEAGHIFVVGDNRDNSLDSRYFGSVPVTDIVGTLSARILPLSEAKKY